MIVDPNEARLRDFAESFADWSIDPGTPVLIACSARKGPERAPARDLYRGDLFRCAVRWAESWDLPWVVLSGRHGIVAPDVELDPYDHQGFEGGVGHHDLRRQLLDLNLPAHPVAVIGGAEYVAAATHWLGAVWPVLQELPLRGLGYYKRWLTMSRRPSPEEENMPTNVHPAERALALLRTVTSRIPADLDVPAAITQWYSNGDRYRSLSRGEQTLLTLVVWCWNGSGQVTLTDLAELDQRCRDGALAVLADHLGVTR